MKNLIIHKQVFFPKTVYYTYIDDDICDEVNKIAYKEKDTWKKGLKNVKAKTSGWYSEHYPIIKELSQFICNQILPKISNYKKWYVNNSWINYYKQGDKAEPHNHFGESIYMCAILLTTNTSKNCLKFIDFDQIESVNEKKGLLIIFPPELEHMVEEVTDKERISVAFDFTVND
jgi:hypothetical protein